VGRIAEAWVERIDGAGGEEIDRVS
jgi:hypothetical protein